MSASFCRWPIHAGAALLCWLMFQPITASSQDITGSVSGTLFDPNGVKAGGLEASITLRSSTSDRTFTAPISPTGDFSIAGVAPDTYDLRIPIGCCMYSSYQQKGVAVQAGEALKLDIQLRWGMNLGTIGDDPGMLGNDMRARAKNTDGPAPRMPDGKPDLSGMWYNITPLGGAGGQGDPPMKPWAAEIQKELMKLGEQHMNAALFCLPQSAIPTTLPFPQKLIQTPHVIVHLVEFMTPGYRQIFLDGRPHPEEWNPAWMGHSTGKWEGDTLVVETVGFNEIAPGFGVHSEQLRVVERFTRPSKGRLEIEITAEDPEAWTGSFTRKIVAGLTPDEEILEFVCPENNKDPLHFGGLGWKGRP